MSFQFEVLNHLVREILEEPEARVWTTQGFGMIRTYLDDRKRFRLNIWTDALKVPNVSQIHNHPWSFHSLIVSGAIINRRYLTPEEPYPHQPFKKPDVRKFQMMTIKTGEEGGPRLDTLTNTELRVLPGTAYRAGMTYYQPAHWMHETLYRNGTVTVNDRSAPTPEHEALVAWERGDWVDAKPRPADEAEIQASCQDAWDTWDFTER